VRLYLVMVYIQDSYSFSFSADVCLLFPTGIQWNDHIMPTSRDTLHWLPVSQCITFKIALMTYDCIHGRSQCTSATSVHRSSPFPFVLGFALLTTMTWFYHVLGPRVTVCAVSASRHPRFETCCHLISRTLMLVTNSWSEALRLGSLCKPTHKRRLWKLCSSGTLQILDLI